MQQIQSVEISDGMSSDWTSIVRNCERAPGRLIARAVAIDDTSRPT